MEELRLLFGEQFVQVAMATLTKGKPQDAWPQKQTALPSAFATTPTDLDETQEDRARKGFDDLSQSFESSKRGASASPVKEKLAELKKLRTSQYNQGGEGSGAILLLLRKQPRIRFSMLSMQCPKSSTRR